MSSTSTQQVRPVIECFCQILSLYGFSPITPEIFRLAKFNQNEATIPLWRLIFEIMHFDPTNNNQQDSMRKFNQTSKDVLVDMIKTHLFTCGYTYKQFLLLDNRMETGSQQLLLCLGWLVHQMKLFDKCIEQCLNYHSIFDYDDTSILHRLDRNNTERVKYTPLEKDLNKQIKQAMRLNSKLRFGLRRLHGLLIESVHLQSQIHGNHHMSSVEAYLCQNPELLSQYAAELEHEQQKINLLLFWNQHADVFWKWMESVLDQTMEHEEEPEELDDKYAPLRPTDSQRLETEKHKFYAAINTLDSALVRLQQLWISNTTDSSIERSDVSTKISSIDTQVSSLFNELLCTNASLPKKSKSDQSLFLHQPRRLVYAKKDGSNNNCVEKSQLEIETKHVNTFQTTIDQHIEKQRQILDTISQQFENTMIV